MAHVTSAEFDTIIRLLSDHYGLPGLHERLLKANALVSRKRPPRWQPLANQLYQLSAGLRREHPARYAVEVLWQELVSETVGDDRQETLNRLAEGINTCLTETLDVVPEKHADLIAALGAYHRALAEAASADVAYTEVVLRASTGVAEFLRAHVDEVSAAANEAESAADTAPNPGVPQS